MTPLSGISVSVLLAAFRSRKSAPPNTPLAWMILPSPSTANRPTRLPARMMVRVSRVLQLKSCFLGWTLYPSTGGQLLASAEDRFRQYGPAYAPLLRLH